MKSELLSQEKNIVTIKVTVDQAGYAAQLKKTYAEIAKRVNIPGFRKGKAPKTVLEMRLGKDSIMSQAFEDMLPKVLDEVCAEYDLEPIASPVVDDLDIKEGEDVSFTVKYEVEPEVTLPEFSDITVDLPVFAVSESMVDEALENMKKRLSTYKPVNRPARHGDKVRAAYSLVVKDDDGKDILSHEPQIDTFELDNLSMRPEIVEALTGTEAGTKKPADINVADDYRDKAVAGKTAHYEFDVIEVQEPVAPEMNEEFFRKVTAENVHSEEELRATIRENLDKRLKADARTAAENEAIAKITEASQVELPDSMVRRQREHLRKRFEENVKQRTKMSLEEYYKSEGHDLKELEENLEKDARRDVMGYLVVDACAKKFGVSVRKEDLDGEISQMAANYGISSDSIKDMLKKRPEDFENMISQARYRKTLQAIMEKVKVNEVKKGVDAEAPAAQN
ncbi:trigger factor [Pyramidobacter sp. SM-530-WT-4B]|uniref:Trigger factor n=1 Tax=Pyramidobacter porci TaxID=2605789 RepID=A0A6L5YAI2_9BACT|nr:trigger factor [Pyramidobacter porci]MST55296.1 trigger factor [Pyramidobacter porci]